VGGGNLDGSVENVKVAIGLWTYVGNTVVFVDDMRVIVS